MGCCEWQAEVTRTVSFVRERRWLSRVLAEQSSLFRRPRVHVASGTDVDDRARAHAVVVSTTVQPQRVTSVLSRLRFGRWQMPRQDRCDGAFADRAFAPDSRNTLVAVKESPTGRSRVARDAAIHAVRRLYAGMTTYQAAKEVQRDLRSYLSRCWPRERYLDELPIGVSELRAALHRLAGANDGRELCWRRIYDILSSGPTAAR